MTEQQVQHVQAELTLIGDSLALAQGVLANHPATEQDETFQQISSAMIQQGQRILELLGQLEQSQN